MRIQETTGIETFLKSPKNIVITNHINPDGDAMGSALGLKIFLEKLSHHVTVLVPNNYPDFLKWLPCTDEVMIYESNQKEGDRLLENADLIFSLDYNAVSRCGLMQETLLKSKAKKMMIDHHQQPEGFVDWMISDTSVCSTAQMVYEFIEDLNAKSDIDIETALCLYTGILTDTGSFRFSSTSAKTHRIVAHFLDLGLKPDMVHNNTFDANSVGRLKLLGAMLDQMIVFKDKNAVVLFLRQDQLNKIGFTKGDTEGFVNYGLSISGIQFSAFLREDDELVKMSFRSKGDLDVNALAREFINGGGHKNAAGGALKMPFDEALSVVTNMIESKL